MISFELLSSVVKEENLEFIRKIRNDNRQYFFNTGYISKAKHRKWFDESYSPFLIKKEFFFYIIKSGDKNIGTLSIQNKGELYEIGNVIILKEHRKKGIFKRFIKQFKKKVNKKIVLKVRADNKNAIEAYKKSGFEEKVIELWM
jgi:ribosomal protein S18 acetylase RimI-like enzyme